MANDIQKYQTVISMCHVHLVIQIVLVSCIQVWSGIEARVA
jgi:hypothetical protein